MPDQYLAGFTAALSAIELVVAPVRGDFDRDGILGTAELVQCLVDDWQRLRLDSLRLTAVERAMTSPL